MRTTRQYYAPWLIMAVLSLLFAPPRLRGNDPTPPRAKSFSDELTPESASLSATASKPTIEEKSSPFNGSHPGEARELVPGIVFRWCPAGSFTMGSPRTELGHDGKHQVDENEVAVTITRGFWLQETEVTQRQFESVMNSAPWFEKDSVQEGSEFPACYVDWYDAVGFTEKLTRQQRVAGRIPQNWKISLPTEAQWEYGCRAGTTTKFSCGNSDASLRDVAWYDEKNTPAKECYAHRAGTKEPNAWGLRDMHGNVWESCLDKYGTKLVGGNDPVGPLTGKFQVYRGGSWIDYSTYCRSAFRYGHLPTIRTSYIGFRVAVVPVN